MAFHQIAYLKPRMTVAWKCLSFTAARPAAGEPLVPVAYASRSPAFFPEHLHAEPTGRAASDEEAVLWVVSAPAYEARERSAVVFPPSLIARVQVRAVVPGETLRRRADDPRDVDPRGPRRGRAGARTMKTALRSRPAGNTPSRPGARSAGSAKRAGTASSRLPPPAGGST